MVLLALITMPVLSKTPAKLVSVFHLPPCSVLHSTSATTLVFATQPLEFALTQSNQTELLALTLISALKQTRAKTVSVSEVTTQFAQLCPLVTWLVFVCLSMDLVPTLAHQE